MQTSTRVQTAFRIEESLLKRLKKQARDDHKSLNRYVEDILGKAVPEISFPKVTFPEELPASVTCLSKGIRTDVKALEEDERYAYIMSK